MLRERDVYPLRVDCREDWGGRGLLAQVIYADMADVYILLTDQDRGLDDASIWLVDHERRAAFDRAPTNPYRGWRRIDAGVAERKYRALPELVLRARIARAHALGAG